jgi:hypothetical protein
MINKLNIPYLSLPLAISNKLIDGNPIGNDALSILL